MEDAYEIGIRLALDNGVSAGVALIQQELAGLDTHIAATAASLRSLQEMAATVSGQPTPRRHPPPPPGRPARPNRPV